jgi:hypothetical protein
LDQSTYVSQLGSYQDMVEQLTGQRPDFKLDMATGNTGDQFSQMIWAAFRSQESQSGFREKLLHDSNIRQQFGWLRFGLQYDDFQNRKTDMRMNFGQDLTDQQALLQLEYMHSAAGAGRGATVQAPQRPPDVGVSEVTVR